MRLKAPVTVQVELTDVCNHFCEHCYNFFRVGEQVVKAPSPVEVRRHIGIADALGEAEVFHVTLSGGEPLVLKPHDLERILIAYSRNGIDVGLNSNLTLVKPVHVEMFRKYGVNVLTSVISHDRDVFERVTQTGGSYDRFIAGVLTLTSGGVRVGANMVVDKSRLGQVYDTGVFVHGLGVGGFNATRVSPSNADRIKDYDKRVLDRGDIKLLMDDLLRLETDLGLSVGMLNAIPFCAVDNPEHYRSLLSHSCMAGINSVGLSSKGDVRACQHFDQNFGNVLDESLQDIWQRVPIFKDAYKIADCKGCVYEVKCGGGCRENSLVMGGSLSGRDNLMGLPLSQSWDGALKDISAIRLLKPLKIREESFGALLYRNVNAYTPIDTFTFACLTGLYGQDVITRDDVVSCYHDGIVPAYVNRLFNKLVNARVAKGV